MDNKEQHHQFIPEKDLKMERRLQEDALGAEILDECRTQLMLKFRFLDLALWRMELEPARVGSHYPLATDGKSVFYDPPRVIARFKESYDEIVRDYLHMIMHCIFRQPFDKSKRNKDIWNLTCDIIVENAIIDLCGERFKSDDDLERRMVVSKIRMAAGGLSPTKVYKLIEGLERTGEGQHHRGISSSVLPSWRALFERDDHAAWPKPAKPDEQDEADSNSETEEFSENDDEPDMSSDGLKTDSSEGQSSDNDQGDRDQNDNVDDLGDGAGNQLGGDADPSENQIQGNETERSEQEEEQNSQEESSGSFVPESDERGSGQERSESHSQQSTDQDASQDEKDWQEISKQIEMNLSTFSKEWGDEAASLMANLQMANRKRYDYREFLQKFMMVTEEMKLNMDEFDISFYTYGMDLYGNMPFIEPLEHKETQSIRDFVIVIDTSESVRGELVKKFILHTFDILKSSEEYSSKVNIHLIQADNKVQSDVVIKDMKDVDKVMQNFVIRGFGGTDFRPAFDHVEGLRLMGELENLKGLLYFTDGYGQFPEKASDFDAAFIFMDNEEHEIPPVPPWAIKVIVDEESLEEGLQ